MTLFRNSFIQVYNWSLLLASVPSGQRNGGVMVRKLWVSLVQFGFRLLYYEMAWSYDMVSWLVSLGEWRRWQAAALPYVQGRTVLELGHGPGHLLVSLQAVNYTLFGIDLSPQMGRQARRRLRQRNLPANLAQARVQALPFNSGYFDTVLSTFPTDYIVDPDTLAAVHRVLRANGRFIVVPEGHLTGQGSLHRLIDWLFRITGQRGGAFRVDEARNWPQPDLWEPFRQRFVAAGFAVSIEQVQLARSAATVLVAEKWSD
jgi:ubiquinone/menaquinone biosynthesis C-methylase UbiE